MSEVSSWADEVRDQSEYKHTAPRHFLSLPLGHDTFVQYVDGLGNENIYNSKTRKVNLKPGGTLEFKF
jgi:hypothetical protein